MVTTNRGQNVLISDDSNAWKVSVSQIGGVSFVVDVVQRASQAVMEIYNRGGEKGEVTKGDGSPVTEADLQSAAIIERALRSVTDIPVVCEEGTTRKEFSGGLFWLVDPLDGTKEFLSRNGEFTINVALIDGTSPVLGVLGCPALGEVFVGEKGAGAYVLRNGRQESISNRRTGNDLIAAISRSHAAPTVADYLSKIGVVETIQCGSALKFCRLAEGLCDLYVRFGRTMEWDTAAGQCILEESGAKLLVASTGERLEYGKAGFANPSFIACRTDLHPRTSTE